MAWWHFRVLRRQESQASTNQFAENCLEALRWLARFAFDPALDHCQKRCGYESRSNRLLNIEVIGYGPRCPFGKRLPYTLLYAFPQYSWGPAGLRARQSSVDLRRGRHMCKKGRGIKRTKIMPLSENHGSDNPAELRRQQIVFRRIVGVKSGAAHPGFFCNVTDPDVAVSPTAKKFDKCRIDMTAGTDNAPVPLRRISANIRDSCRFLFDKCHTSSFSVVPRDQPL